MDISASKGLHLTKPADMQSTAVRELCQRIASEQCPLFVPYEPLGHKPLMECFSIVPEQVVTHGGEQLTGWALWEVAGCFIEAEFHAVWKDPNGRISDLTPRPFDMETVTFLPDPSRVYDGRQVDNIRVPLVNDFYVSKFLKLAARRFEIMNEGDLAYQYGAIALSASAEREYFDIEKAMKDLQARFARKYKG